MLVRRWALPLGIVALLAVLVAAMSGIGNEAVYRSWQQTFPFMLIRDDDDIRATVADHVGDVLDGSLPPTWVDPALKYPDGGHAALTSLSDALSALGEATDRARSIDFGPSGVVGWGIEIRTTVFVIVVYVVSQRSSAVRPPL